MRIIGLVGGVASGKSQVGRTLVELGAGLLDADRAGHAVMNEDQTVRLELQRRWGDEVIAADGSVDRAVVARQVFGDSAEAAVERDFLERLLHPRIRERLEEEMARLADRGCPAAVLDAPLLLEAGWQTLCDAVVFVEASRASRLGRARARGWSESQFDQREAAQWPIERKRAAADVVIHNDGSLDELAAKVRQFWEGFIQPE